MNKKQIAKINNAFDAMHKAARNYIWICSEEGAPVRSITVRTDEDGLHKRTHVIFHRKNLQVVNTCKSENYYVE